MDSLRTERIPLLRVAVAGGVLLLGLFSVALIENSFPFSVLRQRISAFSAHEKGKEVPASAYRAGVNQPKRQPSLSRLPPDVIIDYSYDASHLLNGAGAPLYATDDRYNKFITRLRQYPPEILIVGKEAAFTHSLGPILSFGGENRTFPPVPNRKNDDPRRLLSPDELRLRIKATERFVQDAHAAGVKSVLPYLSPMTMFGNPDKRLGFFQFYDSWEKYAKDFDLGPRPAGDPIEWTQQGKDGDSYFRMGGGKEDVQGFTRYSMCVNNPGWRRWQMLVANWIARVGYDGLFMDNVLLHRCYDKYCKAVAKDMGVDLATDPHSVWVESYLRYFDDLRSEGSRRRGSFFLAGNYLDLPSQRAVSDKLDLTMIERVWSGSSRVLWPGGVWTGFYPSMPNLRVINNRTIGTNEERSLNNLWVVQLAYTMRGDRGTYLLLGAPAGKSPEFAHNEDSGILALAEAGAFGGGIADQIVGQGSRPFSDNSDLGNKARLRFFAFARAHRELYEQLLPAGDVAIVVFPDQDEAALVEAQQVHEALLWRGVLVDVLDGDKQSAATLQKYRLVIVPGQQPPPRWMKELPLLQSPDPLSTAELRNVTKTYQRDKKVTPPRQTRITSLAVERAEGLRSLVLPQNSLLQGCAWANDERMVLHLLNFQVPIGLANGGKVDPIRNISVRLKLPKGKMVRQVNIYSTDVEGVNSLTFKQNGDTLEFKVASIRIYEACEIIFFRQPK